MRSTFNMQTGINFLTEIWRETYFNDQTGANFLAKIWLYHDNQTGENFFWRKFPNRGNIGKTLTFQPKRKSKYWPNEQRTTKAWYLRNIPNSSKAVATMHSHLSHSYHTTFLCAHYSTLDTFQTSWCTKSLIAILQKFAFTVRRLHILTYNMFTTVTWFLNS
jgi:hypothetical protein